MKLVTLERNDYLGLQFTVMATKEGQFRLIMTDTDVDAVIGIITYKDLQDALDYGRKFLGRRDEHEPFDRCQ